MDAHNVIQWPRTAPGDDGLTAPRTDSLSVILGVIEIEAKVTGIDATRAAVVAAARSFRNSRFQLGQALAEYKQGFVGDESWTSVVQAVAKSVNVSERTIWRVLAGYKEASESPGSDLEQPLSTGIAPPAGEDFASSTVARGSSGRSRAALSES